MEEQLFTLTIAYAGLIGFGVIGTILSGGNITELKPNTQIMEQFIIPISIFAAVLVIGLIAGGLTFSSKLFMLQEEGCQHHYEMSDTWLGE